MKEDSEDGVAVIEISLNWDSGAKQKIRTQINRNSTEPHFSVNEEDVDKDFVVSLAKGANIVPSNMCQFLPQEKVSHFSRMDHKLLFLLV